MTTQTTETRINQIVSIVSGIKACTMCELHKTTTSPTPGLIQITGVGGVAVIGEAPGRQEEHEGKPFVGPAGQLLKAACEKIGLDHSRLALINTVCCRPPGNDYKKALAVGAVKACSGWYDMQIQLSGAWVLVPMGNRALTKYSEQRIGQARGKAFWKDDHLIVPTWHPAYVLRNPDARTEFYQDLRQVKEILEGERLYPKPDDYEPAKALNALRRPPAYTTAQADRFRLHFKSKGWLQAYSHWLEDYVIVVKDEGVQVPKSVQGVVYQLHELVQVSHMDRNWEMARQMHYVKKELDAQLI